MSNNVAKLLGVKKPASYNWIVNNEPSPKKSKPNPVEKRARSANNSAGAGPSTKKAKAANSPRTTAMRKVLAIRKGNMFVNRVGDLCALSKPVVTWSSTSTSVGGSIDLSTLAKVVTVPGKYATTEVAGFQSAGTKLPHFRETLNKPAVGKINPTVSFVKLNMVLLDPGQTASGAWG